MPSRDYESLVPEFSRACDLYDDEELIRQRPSPSWMWSREVAPVQHLVLTAGVLPSAVLAGAVDLSAGEIVASVLVNDVAPDEAITLSQRSSSDPTNYLRVWRCAGVGTALALFNEPPKRGAREILDILKPETVVILAHSPKTAYQCANPEEVGNGPVTRSLHTAVFSGTPNWPKLETPNLITGLPADLLTECEIAGIGAIVYCCYGDGDFDDVAAFEELFSSSLLQNLPRSTEKRQHSTSKPIPTNGVLYI